MLKTLLPGLVMWVCANPYGIKCPKPGSSLCESTILVVHKRVSLWQVLNHLLLLARCTGARSEMLTAKLPGLRTIAVENRKGGWYGSKDGYVTSVCPNMAPQISTSKSLAFLDQTKSQNHSCKPRTLVMLRRNHPGFELRSY